MADQLNLAYIISHGHTARGALQTGLILKLVNDGFNVFIISKSAGDEEFRKLTEAQNARILEYNFRSNTFKNQLSIFRSYVHQNIKENPALWEKHQRRANDKASSYKRRILNRFYLRAGWVIRNISILKSLYHFVEKNTYFNDSALNLLKKNKINAVISTRPSDDMEAEILCAAEKLELTRIIYILSWDNITTKGIFPFLADYYLTWGEVMIKELDDYYDVKKDKILPTGVTHFDVHYQVKNGIIDSSIYLEQLGLKLQDQYLLFTMSASYFAPNEIDIIEYLAFKVEEGFYGKGIKLVIRPHMANLMKSRSDQSWLDRLKKIQSENVILNIPKGKNELLTWYMEKDDMLQLSSLINHSKACLNSGSTISIEAIYQDKPVIITTFDTENWPEWRSVKRILEYEHLKKFFDFDACTIVNDFEQMDSSIHEYLKNADLKVEQRKEAIREECFKNDGKSTQRFIENVTKILKV